MSVASEIERISGNIATAYSTAEEMGATMPETQNSDNLASTIATISVGGVTSVNGQTGEVVLDAADVGAVNKAGDTMTGSLIIAKATYPQVMIVDTTANTGTKHQTSSHVTDYQLLDNWESTDQYRGIRIYDKSYTPNLSRSLVLRDKVSGVDVVEYPIFHAGNKPSGSYTGNGSTTTRDISMNGIGQVCAVWGNNQTFALITQHYTLCTTSSDTYLTKVTGTYYAAGQYIRLKTTHEALNANGVTYTYQCL